MIFSRLCVNKIRSFRPARCILFFDGNCRKHRYEITGTEKIRYVDVSLYPYVGNGKLSCTITPIFIGEECSKLIGKAPNINFDFIESLVRWKILPSRNLFHLVLPYRVKGKLLLFYIGATRCTSMKWRFKKQTNAHQCSVKYKDLTYTPFYCTINKCQSDLIEKCLHSIVLLVLCLIWRNLYQIRSIRGQH